jgi:hypothetical protein
MLPRVVVEATVRGPGVLSCFVADPIVSAAVDSCVRRGCHRHRDREN